MPKVIKGLTRLHSLDAAEVSLVPEGANRRRFLIFKSSGGKMPHPHEEIQKLISKENPEVMKKVDEAMKSHAQKAHAKKMADKEKEAAQKDLDGGEGDHAGVLDEQAQAALKAIVRILTPMKDKISPDMLHEVLEAADFSLGEKEGSLADDESEEGDDYEHEGEAGAMHVGDGHKLAEFMAIPEEVEGVSKEHMDGAKMAAHGAYKEHLEKLGYEKYPVAEMAMKSKDGHPVEKEKGEEVSKSANSAPNLSAVDSKNRETLEAVFKSNKELVQKNADLEAKINEITKTTREKEIVAKAASFTHIGLSNDDIVATLKDADKVGKESYERVCKQFDTLNEQGRSGKLFGEIGSNLTGASEGTDGAWAKIEKAAQGHVAKSGVAMTTAQAMEAFLTTSEGQKLYGEYKSGRKDGI